MLKSLEVIGTKTEKLIDAVKNKKAVLPLILVAAALAALALYRGGDTEEKREYCVELLSDELEDKIEKLCLSVSGVRRAEVLLTLDTSEEYVMAKDVEQNGEYRKSVTVDAEGGGIELCVVSPKVRGVAVVCTGGDKPAVKQKIISLVSSALGLDSSKISVAGT